MLLLRFSSRRAQEVELAFYGDSVVELLRGTVHMEPDPRGHGIPEVFHQHFGQKYRAAAFGISGKQLALALSLLLRSPLLRTLVLRIGRILHPSMTADL